MDPKQEKEILSHCLYWDDVKPAPLGTSVHMAVAVFIAPLSSVSPAGQRQLLGQNSSQKLVTAKRFDCTLQDGGLGLSCNLFFFLGITGFAKRTFLYHILMGESEGASLPNQEQFGF